MDIQVEQGCPQCGAPITSCEDDRFLACEFCGVKNFLQTSGPFRYVLPDKVEPGKRSDLVYAPYIRLKSNLFHISEKGIACKIIDTTQLGFIMPGLPPSLGLRPQAMKIRRLTPETGGGFLHLSVKAKVILDKAVMLSKMSGDIGEELLHRAFIGDTVSLIYLPLLTDGENLLDAVINSPLTTLERIGDYSLQGTGFNPSWQINFLPAICPKCGWDLEGYKDCLVPACRNCETAWEIGKHGLRNIPWQVQPGDHDTALHLPFWKITAQIPALDILSFADFVRRANLPMVPRPDWQNRAMQFWIPAFKLRPKIFLQVARQATAGQFRLNLETGRNAPDLYPANLPQTEARQAIKVVLAACAVSERNILPHLPGTKVKTAQCTLAYLPFHDRNHDWVQPHTGTVVQKSALRFGRNL